MYSFFGVKLLARSVCVGYVFSETLIRQSYLFTVSIVFGSFVF